MGNRITGNAANNIFIIGLLSTFLFHIECFRTEQLKCDPTLCNNGDCYIKTNSITVGSEVEGYFMDCPYEYNLHNGRCWEVVMEKKRWQDAYIYPNTGWVLDLLIEGRSELAAGYIKKELSGDHSWVWINALIDRNNTLVSWNPPVPRYGNSTTSRFTLHSNDSCIALGPTNYTHWDTFDCETELYSLRATHSIPRPQTRNYTCRCQPRYSGESCETIDSQLRTPELTNPIALQCDGDTVIFVEFALYGYKANDSTGMDCAAPNTLAVLRYLCQGKDSCKLEPLILDAYIGHVCTNPNATLAVRYSCVHPSDMSCPLAMGEIHHENSTTCELTISADMSWNKSMEYCLLNGGMFAAFKGTIPYQFYAADDQPIPAFWIFDQLPNMRPDTTHPVECTMATVVNQTKPPNIYVAKDCSQRLSGICAIPPDYHARRSHMVTTMRSTSNTWYLPDNTTMANASYNITEAVVDTTTDTMMVTTAYKPEITSYSMPQTTSPHSKTCSARNHNGITWPETIHGVTVIKPCPAGQNGYAIWNCGYNGEFNTKGPDHSNCTTTLSIDIAALSNNLVMGTHADVVVTELATVLEAAQTMASGDIVNSINLLDKAILAQQETLQNITDKVEREKTMNTFTFGILNTSAVLLGTQHLPTWYGLTETNRTKAAATLISDVDSTAILYASVLPTGTRKLIQYNTTIKIYIETRDPTDFSQLELPNIIVPSEAIAAAIANLQYSRFLPIAASTYNTIGQIMPIGDHFQNFTNITQVIGATLNETIQLAHDKVSVIIEKPTGAISLNQSLCVFWNESQWSTDGCELSDETNDTHFVCKCDHMTSFAVLMSFNPKKVDIMALNIITITGCSISVLCLAACIITFLIVRSLRTFCYKVHLHLCISLMIANTVFITAHYYKAYHRDIDKFCTALAMLMHYFYLASFMWMFLEGVQIYLALVRVFAPAKNRGYVYYLIGYGIPGLVVGISAGVNMEGYASATHCFLDTASGFVWGFIAFVLMTLIFNTVLLFLSLKSASRLKHMRNAKQTESAKQWLWQITILHPLLGLTWYFGLLQFGDQLVFSYVFTILNSLQGTFIFLFHVFRNEDVRHYFARIYFICGANDVETKRITRTPVESSSGQREEAEREHIITNRKLGPSPRWKKDIAMDRIASGQTEADLNEQVVLHGAYAVESNFIDN